jgi:hypothetical protein
MNQDQQVAQIFEKLGSAPEQAIRMARQLIKRAEQLSETENIPFLESLERLLKLCIGGAQGEIDPNFTPFSKKSKKS